MLFSQIQIIPLSQNVAFEAIKLRQQQRITLGDSIIAATALLAGGALITANVKDFERISNLNIINPL
ncbi:PIN domain-containing protein [Litoribacter ruber]|nr:PIN domain-containing protein [Litoribacter ruber]